MKINFLNYLSFCGAGIQDCSSIPDSSPRTISASNKQHNISISPRERPILDVKNNKDKNLGAFLKV